MEAKKVVLKLEIYNDKCKQKAMKTVSHIRGIDSISMDMKDRKLTVTGDIDPVIIAKKLRKLCVTQIISVGAAKEEKKKDEPKKDAKKDKKKDDEFDCYWKYPPPCYIRIVEDDPYRCVIL